MEIELPKQDHNTPQGVHPGGFPVLIFLLSIIPISIKFLRRFFEIWVLDGRLYSFRWIAICARYAARVREDIKVSASAGAPQPTTAHTSEPGTAFHDTKCLCNQTSCSKRGIHFRSQTLLSSSRYFTLRLFNNLIHAIDTMKTIVFPFIFPY